jgi:hypothetical protein
MNIRNLTIVPAVTGAVLVALAVPAFATWGTQASGTGKAGNSTLGTPNTSLPSCTNGTTTDTVVVSWTALAGATSYKVERKVGTGAYAVVQTSTALSYTVNEPRSSGSYNYRVTGLVGNWVSPSSVRGQTINNGGNCQTSS